MKKRGVVAKTSPKKPLGEFIKRRLELENTSLRLKAHAWGITKGTLASALHRDKYSPALLAHVCAFLGAEEATLRKEYEFQVTRSRTPRFETPIKRQQRLSALLREGESEIVGTLERMSPRDIFVYIALDKSPSHFDTDSSAASAAAKALGQGGQLLYIRPSDCALNTFGQAGIAPLPREAGIVEEFVRMQEYVLSQSELAAQNMTLILHDSAAVFSLFDAYSFHRFDEDGERKSIAITREALYVGRGSAELSSFIVRDRSAMIRLSSVIHTAVRAAVRSPKYQRFTVYSCPANTMDGRVDTPELSEIRNRLL